MIHDEWRIIQEYGVFFTKFLSCAVLKETVMERVDWHPADLVSFPPSKSGKYSAHRVSQKHRPCHPHVQAAGTIYYMEFCWRCFRKMPEICIPT